MIEAFQIISIILHLFLKIRNINIKNGKNARIKRNTKPMINLSKGIGPGSVINIRTSISDGNIRYQESLNRNFPIKNRRKFSHVVNFGVKQDF